MPTLYRVIVFERQVALLLQPILITGNFRDMRGHVSSPLRGWQVQKKGGVNCLLHAPSIALFKCLLPQRGA
jgi:hypothetical protein